MPIITFVHPNGLEQVFDVVPGTSVMKAAVTNGVEGIVGECGGQAMCATCHVYVREGFLEGLPPMNDDEAEMLEETAAPRNEDRSRLGCQLKMGSQLDALVVDLPLTQVDV